MDDSITVVAPQDEGIDHEASDWEGYFAKWNTPGANWRDFIKPRDGQQVTEFVLGVIPAAEMARINDECKAFTAEPRNQELRWRSFCWSLRDLKGWPTKVPKVDRAGVDYVDPEWIQETFVRGLRAAAMFVGQHAWLFNTLSDGEVKN